MLTYYDSSTGSERFKRRYIWGFWAFVAGAALGAAVVAML